MEISMFTSYAQKVLSNCSRVIVGKESAIEKILVCFICSGHVLLEDRPGTGKTMLLRAFARTVGGDCRRVQCTPDLLPSDLTGINFYNQKTGEFEFRPGPLFSHFVLADELNRATPRTQSALLEAMAERQITVDGVTTRLEEPFMVLATQNPLESFGTFPLPDAQMDRFFMRLSLGYMQRQQELEVIARPSTQAVLDGLETLVTPEQTAYVRSAYTEVKVSDDVKNYLMDIAEATRTRSSFAGGVSTRGAIALYKASQALAAVRGRDYVIPEDIKELAPAVLVILVLVLQAYTQKHALDGLEAGMIPEDLLAEPGEPVCLHLTLRNQKGWTRPLVFLKLHLHPSFEMQDADCVQRDILGKGHTVQYVTWLKPHQEASWNLEVCLTSRGRYLLEPLYLGSGDFLGMNEQTRRATALQELIVPPRERPLPALDAAMGGFLGELSVNRFLYQDPILTAGYRPYTSQDPMRSISWKQSARGMGLISKNYDATTEPRVTVLVHAATSLEDQMQAVEDCYSMARTVCRMLEEKAISYRLAVNSTFDVLIHGALVAGNAWNKPLETGQGYGPEHFRRALEILGRATGQPAEPCERFCTEYFGPGTQDSCILITTEPKETVRPYLHLPAGCSLLILRPDQPTEREDTP